MEATGIHVDFESQLGEERLPSEVETTLYRIVQESLTNIAKHAGARHVSVLLVRRGRVGDSRSSRTTGMDSTRRTSCGAASACPGCASASRCWTAG